MGFKYFFVFWALFLSSCSIQPSEGLKQWWNNWKDYSLTQLASESTSNLLEEEDQADLLVLFLDLEESRNCSTFKKWIEQNETLNRIGENNNFNKGFLFDALNGYNYERTVFMGGGSKKRLDEVAFLVVGAWKTEFTLERINRVIRDANVCYPYGNST